MNERRKFRLKGNSKLKDLLLLSCLALLLSAAVWRIFYTDGSNHAASGGNALKSESERALCELLSKIEGVGEADVIICEDENGVKSVVVVCDGANDIRVNTEVREAAAAAVGTQEKNVKIYKKSN